MVIGLKRSFYIHLDKFSQEIHRATGSGPKVSGLKKPLKR